jgi:hypothetical protein
MKKETLEEAAEIYVWGGIYLNEAEKQQTEIAFIEGANWQAERMYSEEDMKTLIDIINWYDENSDVCPNFEIPEIKKGVALIDWFVDFEEQFKKK